ncbi:MAG TPA: tyrosinase family protein [Gaiellales bacterium]
MEATALIPTHPPGVLRHRLSVDKLDDGQLARFREAIRLAGQRLDNRGFSWWAGVHGVPQGYCQHHVENEHGARYFLPWHRAYLYQFELTLRDLVPDVTLPWWDWTFDAAHPRWIPDAYAQKKLADGSANPLESQPIPRMTQPPVPEQPRQTTRAANAPGAAWQPTAEYVDKTLLNIKNYFKFSLALEGIHDGIHGHVGGTMANIGWAAYDPLFWAHHVMIDRIWALWQDRNGIAGPTPDMFEEILEPFNLRVPQVLEISRLGYTYAASSVRVLGNR